MKEIDKKRTSINNQGKRSGKPNKREPQPRQDNARKILSEKETGSKASQARPDSSTLVSDLNVGTESPEYESLVIHYVDDVNRSEKLSQDSKVNMMISRVTKGGSSDDYSSDLDKESKQGKEESDSETVNDSVSSQGDFPEAEDEKVARVSRTPKSNAKKNSSDSGPRGSRVRPDRETNKLRSKVLPNTPKKVTKTGRNASQIATKTSADDSNNKRVPHKVSSESSDDKPIEEVKGIDLLDETSNNGHSVGSDDDTVDNNENGGHEKDVALDRTIEEMEARIDKLEEELREVAALEISLYSVVPEHGSSAHKVHTPARRLSRLYIHAGRHWTQDKRASIAKNTVSGLLLVAKSCGNDVPRLTFWLSNTIVLREIICQAFGSSRHSSTVTRLSESKGISKRSELKSTDQKWKASASSRQINGFVQLIDNWHETETLSGALEKVESWIFSRIVESVWWQALTPNIHSPSDKSSTNTSGRVSGPALGDERFSINLWKNAFQDAFQRLCPVRAGGHECGCLPMLGRMAMEYCVSRLDVAMFNALLRESAHEIPTDPVSDPILDSKVLPITAGDLSFGSGAQLKNSVGNWSRWLTDMFDMDTDDHLEGDRDEDSIEDNKSQGGKPKSFILLNSLSDLLMLPKDMLLDRSIRKEVCPSITIQLVKRILCNFTPDEFCPDAVPGAVLEALHAEGIVERRLSGETARSFPYTAAPIVYTPPPSTDVAKKVAEAGGKSDSSRKGYTSDEELDELDSPLTAFIEKMPPSPSIVAHGNGNYKQQKANAGINLRYDLLRDVWAL